MNIVNLNIHIEKLQIWIVEKLQIWIVISLRVPANGCRNKSNIRRFKGSNKVDPVNLKIVWFRNCIGALQFESIIIVDNTKFQQGLENLIFFQNWKILSYLDLAEI